MKNPIIKHLVERLNTKPTNNSPLQKCERCHIKRKKLNEKNHCETCENASGFTVHPLIINSIKNPEAS